MGKPEGKGP